MAIGRISGPMLYSNLERQGVDLAIEGNLIYADVTNLRVGVNTSTPDAELQVVGQSHLGNIVVTGNVISSTTGHVNLGSTANVVITGGASDYVLVTDGAGNLRWDEVSNLDQTWGNLFFSGNQISITEIDGNLELAANGSGYVVALNDLYAPNVIAGNVDANYFNGDVRASEIITSGNIVSSFVISNVVGDVSGNLTGANVTVTGNITSDYLNGNVRANNIISTGNVTASYFIGDLVGNIAGQLQGDVFGNITGNNASFSGNVNSEWFNGNITGSNSNFVTSNAATFYGNIFARQVTSSVGDLHLSAATNDPNNIIRFDSVSAFDIPSGSSAQRPPTPDYGYVRYNTDLGTIEWWGGSTWVPGSNLVVSENITPDGVNAVFTLGQETIESAILVNINGTIQQAGTGAYSVTGNQITFAEVPLVTDIIEIRYIASGIAALSIQFGNIASNVTPSANVTYDLGSSDRRWRDLWLSGNSINIGSETISVNNGAFAFTSNGGAQTGNVFLGNVTTSGKVLISDTTDAIPYVMGSGAFHVAGGMSIGKDFWVGGNIYVANVISQTTTILEVNEPLVYLDASNTLYNYDIGVFSDFTGGSANIYQYTGAVRSYQTNEWVFFSNLDTAPGGGIVSITSANILYDPVKAGNLLAANTTPSTSTDTGALIVKGGAGIAGALYIANTGDVSANIGAYQTFANANASSQATSLNAINANIGEFYNYANTKIGTNTNGNLVITATTTSTSTTTGALIVGGGAGFAANIFTAGWIIPSGNVSQNLGSSTSWWNLVYGRSVQAQYADLAENYESDSEYPPGTVVIFGGDKEITISTVSHDTRVAGVISENPAYLMNAATGGQPVAFTGRVKCYVQGPVSKGTVLTSSDVPGVAQSLISSLHNPGCVLGKSLDSISDTSIQLVEIVVGRF